MPVAVAMPFPLPLVTTVPAKSMFLLSATGASSDRVAAASFSSGTDSPVNTDSSAAILYASIILQSAGILSPLFIIRISPDTISVVSIS